MAGGVIYPEYPYKTGKRIGGTLTDITPENRRDYRKSAFVTAGFTAAYMSGC